MKKQTQPPRSIRKKNFQKFDGTLYAGMTLDSLVLFAFYALRERRTEFELEELVSACFRLFPKKFALKKFFRWPDSAVVARHWQECRRKKYVVAEGDSRFRLSAKGMRVVRLAAKALGVELPKPKKKVKEAAPAEKVKPAEKKVAPAAKAEVKPAEKKVAPAEKVKPAAKKVAPAAKAEVKPAEKKVAPAEKVKPAAKKVAPAAKAEVKPAAKKVAPAAKAEVKPAEKKVAPAAKAEVKPAEKAEQLPLPHPKPAPKPKAESAATIWKEVLHPPAPSVPAVQSQPEKETPPAPSVSPEARIRAGKFVRMMETSDAYIQYKKYGTSSNISEFDFRSLLLCTMESSPETLARNVEQFKGYAAIHHRGDLVAFLDFCAGRFAALLVPQKKVGRSKR